MTSVSSTPAPQRYERMPSSADVSSSGTERSSGQTGGSGNAVQSFFESAVPTTSSSSPATTTPAQSAGPSVQAASVSSPATTTPAQSAAPSVQARSASPQVTTSNLGQGNVQAPSSNGNTPNPMLDQLLALGVSLDRAIAIDNLAREFGVFGYHSA